MPYTPWSASLICSISLSFYVATSHGQTEQGAQNPRQSRNTDVSRQSNDGRINRLIEKLGSRDLKERESGTKALLEVGRPALNPLRKAAAGSADAEIRRRAGQIIKWLDQDEERFKAFAWFGSLWFPDPKDRWFIRVTDDWWPDGNNAPINPTHYFGFLLEENKSSLKVLTADLELKTFQKVTRYPAGQARVSYKQLDLGQGTRAYLDAQPNSQRSEFEYSISRFREDLPKRSAVFFLAWACWRNGLDGRAAELYAHAASIPWYGGSPIQQDGAMLQQRVSVDIVRAEISRGGKDFGEPSISRSQLLDRFERVIRYFPASEQISWAKKTAAILKQMLKEDEEHARKRRAGPAFERLNKQERIAELIFQLRDQNGHQTFQPGSCDVFDIDRIGLREDSPAHLLVKVGYEAIPQLIEALDDQRFSRSVDFSNSVLRISDCAEQIIKRIAGRSFEAPRTPSGATLKDVEARTVKKQIQDWYRELQKKGARQLLVEATSRGDEDSLKQAELLVEQFPDQALDAIVRGVRAANRSWIRAKLVTAAGKIKGDAATAFLLSESKDSPSRYTRLAAAQALHSRGQPEGVAAMIAEWKSGRPTAPLRAGTAPDDDDPFGDGTLAAVARFLVDSGKIEAIRALGSGLDKRPSELRMAVLSAFGRFGDMAFVFNGGNLWFSPEFSQYYKPTVESEKLRSAIEELLIAELDDTEQQIGLFGGFYGKSYHVPRLCDFAGVVLAGGAPDKYKFDVSPSQAQRDKGRIEIINKWRKAHGQTPLTLPTRPAGPAVDVKQLRPLIDEWLRLPEDKRAGTEIRIQRLGLGALPEILKRMGTTESKADRAALERLSQRVACIVVRIETADVSVKPDAALAKRLAAMKGEPLDPAELVDIIKSLMKNLPSGVHGLCFTLTRCDDGTGIAVSVDLLNKDRTEQLGPEVRIAQEPGMPRNMPYSWRERTVVVVGSKALRNGSGESVSQTSYAIGPGLAELRESLALACSAPVHESIEARIQLIAQWPK
jgi:hypothetical protein